MDRPTIFVLREPVATREETSRGGPSASSRVTSVKARDSFQPIEQLLPRLSLSERRVAFA